MSHTVKIETKFKELRSLKEALADLGWTVKENAKLRNYGYDDKIYKWVAVNPRKGSIDYDIGIEQEGDELKMYGDFYGGSITQTLGQDLSRLKQGYAVKVIENELEPLGYMVNQTTLDNGFIEISAEQA